MTDTNGPLVGPAEEPCSRDAEGVLHRYPADMIARVAHFEGQSDRFTTGHAYRYTLEAVSAIDGFVAGYHLSGMAGSLSITIWEDEAAMRLGEAAVGEARERLQLPGSPPDRVETYEVANSRVN